MTAPSPASRALKVIVVSSAFASFVIGIVFGRWASGRGDALAWGAAVWGAAQGILAFRPLIREAENSLNEAWEAVTNVIQSLLGLAVLGFAVGTAWGRDAFLPLLGILVVVAVPYVASKVIVSRRSAAAASGAATA